MQYLPLLILTLAVLLDARAQGLLNRLTRQFVPPSAQAQVNTPLHVLYPLLFCLLVGAVSAAAGWWWLAVGGLLRLALFDVVLNATKRDPLFAVGSSAATDRLLRKLWPAHPERLSALVRLAALVVVVILVLLYHA